MRRAAVLLLMIISLSFPAFSGGEFILSVTGNFSFPADKDFKEIYDNQVFFPELKAGISVYDDLYIWGGYGLLKATGETPTLKEESKSTQNLMSFGIGYMSDISKSFGIKVEAGGIYISYKEESMGEEIDNSTFGFRVDGGILFNISKSFFLQAVIGYISATDKPEGVKIKLGGFFAGIGLGITF